MRGLKDISGIINWVLKSDWIPASILFVGLGGLYFSTVVKNPYSLLYPLSLIIGSCGFLAIRSRSENKFPSTSTTVEKTVLTSYFLILSTLVAQYYISGFWRTDSVFYLTFVLYVTGALYILLKPRPIIGLGLIAISGLANRFTAYYSSELYSGHDIYSHVEHIQTILGSGSLEGLVASQYFYAPLYHIQAAIGGIIFDVVIKDAIAMTTLATLTLVPLLVVYSVTVYYWGTRIGLIAAFLYTISDHTIRWGVHIIPTSIGIAFFALLLFALILYYREDDIRYYFLIVVAFGALMITHQVSLFISTVGVVTFATSMSIIQGKVSSRSRNIGLLACSIVFLDFIHTRYTGPQGDASFFDVILGSLFSSLLTAGTETRPELSFPEDPTISPPGAAAMANVDLLGSAIFLTFAVVGALFWLQDPKNKIRRGFGFALGIPVAIFMTIALGGPIIGLRNLLPGRWWAFLYIFLAIFAAIGVIGTIARFPDLNERKALIYPTVGLLILFPVVTLMVGAPIASQDDPFIDKSFDAERLGVTEQEVAIVDHTENVRPEDMTVESDSRFYYQSETVQMDYSNPNSIATDEPKLLVNRSYASEHQARYTVQLGVEEWTVHGGVPIEKIQTDYKSTIYDNGEDTLLWISR